LTTSISETYTAINWDIPENPQRRVVPMKKLALLLFSISIILPLVGMMGCETDPSDQISITITPNTASLAQGASQEFVASGWTGYFWSLSNSSAGVLSTTTGDRTTYTAVTSLTSNTTQVLTVTVNTGSTTTTTNGTTSTATAEALITHL
jgi:hypothetical protein